ncbi:MAG TPA: cyclophilin-like fold protein, partial [Ramlibacter sp.]|nr:cyclophilin-like fold protein [Ramlibacter sp.]
MNKKAIGIAAMVAATLLPTFGAAAADACMTVGTKRFAVTLADTEAARAFAARLPMTLDMGDLHNNEKHVKLPQALPTAASRPGTIRNGDLMLWGSDTLVVFYLGFPSEYAYTRLGRIEDAGGLAQALG